MSRSDYSDECEHINLYRSAVERAIKGKRGQAMLKELLAALDSLPEKALAANSLVTAEGEYCALGVLGARRGIDLYDLDPENSEGVAKAFGIADAMIREIVYMNDEYHNGYKYVDGKLVYKPETPEERWQRMRSWVVAQIKVAE